MNKKTFVKWALQLKVKKAKDRVYLATSVKGSKADYWTPSFDPAFLRLFMKRKYATNTLKMKKLDAKPVKFRITVLRENKY